MEMDMELETQKQQTQPWEEGEQGEEVEEVEEEETALLRRRSGSGLANGRNEHIEEHKDNAAANCPQKKNSVYFDNNQGNGSADGVSGTRYTGFESSVLETNSRDKELLVEANNLDSQRILSTEISSCSILSPAKILSEEEIPNFVHLDNKTGVDIDFDILDEIDQDSIEFDVERVLEKQNTHDLYCPNCHSCITRRVILHRRNRKLRNIRRKSKNGKFETQSTAAVTTDQVEDTLNNCSNDSPTPADDDKNHDRQQDVFGCLSCFSLFIPTGNGFRLFRAFGDSDKNGEVQNVQNVITSKTNWYFSVFASDKRKPTTDQGNSQPEDSEVDGINQNTSSYCSENVLPCPGSDLPVAPLSDTNPAKTLSPSEDPIRSQQGGLESLNSAVESVLLEKLPMPIDQETNMATGKNEIADHNGLEKSIEGASLQTESFWSIGIVNSAATELLETGDSTVTSSAKELIPIIGVPCDVGEKSDNAMVETSAGEDVLVIIEKQPAEVESSQGAQNVGVCVNAGSLPQTEIHVGETTGTEASEGHQWDILKSIVYGGLVESITSLGVVTSAAAAGAATLDIFAMGLANLMGGLVIVAHNLRELKNDHAGEHSTHMNKQEDRYQKLLGRRENFLLHATVVVLSFLIFGLIPPVIYGFSFSKSDNRDLKIAAVAGSSLVCIILLAIVKLHTQEPPRSYMKTILYRSYMKTILYYVSIGLMTSGLSYAVGDLLKKLLVKLNSFESNLDLTVPFLETNVVKTKWETY